MAQSARIPYVSQMRHRGGSLAPAFLGGGGAAGAVLRVLPWDGTGLGHPADWPPALRSAVALCLHAAVPTAVFWGPDLRIIFGDAWAPLLGPGAATAMARPAEDALPGLWPQLAPQLRRALEGTGVSAQQVPVKLPRGRDAFWTYSFSPVLDSSGRRLGVLATVSDVTDHVLARRRQDAIIELGDRFAAMDDPEEIVRLGCEVIGRTLGVARVGRGIVDEAAGTVAVSAAWCNGLPKPDGVHDLALFWDDWTLSGPEPAPMMVDNVATDERLGVRAAGFRGRGVGAFMTVPVVEEGRVRLLTFVQSAAPRSWRSADLAFVRDVVSRGRAAAERARAQAALREIDTRNRHSVALSPLFMWTADAEGNLDHVDERLTARTGNPGLGGKWVESLHPDDRARTLGAWRRALDAGAGYDVEHRMLMPSDPDTPGYRWMRSRANPQRDASGRVVKWYGLSEDIQEVVRAREVLARSRSEMERLAAELAADRERMWRLSTDLMAILRLDGTVMAVNPAWRRVLGWTPQLLVGQGLAELVHEDDRVLVDAAFARLRDGEPVAPVESRLRGQDGAFRVLSWTAVPAGGLVHAIGRDKTAERAAAAELAAAQETLRQAQKMEAVGQLTGGIAHDFNNMLAVVVGSLDMLTRRLGGNDGQRDERAARHIANAMEGARRAAALTNRLLAFSRQQNLSPVVLDVGALLDRMAEWLGASLGGAVRLEVEAGDLLPVLADENQLENAILNLAVNARDAMPGGGRLSIAASNAIVGSGGPCPPGEYVRILVSDTGSGIPPDVIGRVFDPFFTTKEIGKGTGLGLSQVYGFVTQSGGNIAITSAPGDGTMVAIHLPRHCAEVATGAASPDPDNVPAAEPGAAVLVVEDEPAVRRFTAEAMAELGYRVMEADAAAPALAMLDRTDDVRLLFTDVVMPDMDGRALAAEAKRRRPGLKVLFTSGFAPGSGSMNEADGAVLPKPFTLDQLVVAVRGALE